MLQFRFLDIQIRFLHTKRIGQIQKPTIISILSELFIGNVFVLYLVVPALQLSVNISIL